jgi:tol-pal system protein YbgF
MLGVGALALTLFAAPLWAQSAETRALLDRINQLEVQVQDLSRRAYAGGYVPGSVTTTSGNTSDGAMSPDMVTRLAAIETSLRELTGDVERANFQATQANQNLEKLKADLEVRLAALEQRPATAAAAPTDGQELAEGESKPAQDQPKEEAKKDTPEALYNQAYGALQRKEYATAEKDFRAFLEANPSHKLSPNAQYWLGESYFARGNYKAASAVFAESYQKFPKATKAPDSLLKLGLSLSQQKRDKDACTVLRQLAKEYPKASGTIASRTEDELEKLKCP